MLLRLQQSTGPDEAKISSRRLSTTVSSTTVSSTRLSTTVSSTRLSKTVSSTTVSSTRLSVLHDCQFYTTVSSTRLSVRRLSTTTRVFARRPRSTLKASPVRPVQCVFCDNKVRRKKGKERRRGRG
ncbi:hypothetical protein F2P81_021489 [Scophthalmus maximus]|uniref:Uncharacterized protein n=1 Tax=Scophthalmus maximus TaxID=52904 RepID=A0A6A4S659_SCOMX|nr:hypothetical protein F2P81_021489 [Scophthalmus maximus]